jgi:hypothetical protein
VRTVVPVAGGFAANNSEMLRDAFGEHLFAIRPYASHVPRAVAVFVEFLRASFAVGFIR